MIANKNEAKTITDHISCDCKYKLKVHHAIHIKSGTIKHLCKNCRKCKEDYSWIPSTCIWENSNHLKSIADNSVTECNEIQML